MPEIIVYNIDVDVDVDVEDFLDECSDEEIKKVIEWLSGNGFSIPQINPLSNMTYDEEIFIKNINKIYLNLLKVTPQQMQVINQIAINL